MERKLLSSFCLNWHSRKLRYLYTARTFFNLNKEEFLYILTEVFHHFIRVLYTCTPFYLQ